MIDLLQAAQTAVFLKLEAAAGLTALASVYQHVPENTQPPMVIVGNIDSEDIGGKNEQFEQITVEIVSVYRGAGRAPLLDIMHQVRAALDGQELSFAGVAFDTPAWTHAATDGPAADGITYAGLTTFTINAEPA